MGTEIRRPRIFSYLTKTRFLHIEDSLAKGKLRFFVGSYEKGQGMNATAYAFLDVEDARVVMSDLAWGKIIDFIDFKGGKDDTNAIISRVLKFKTKDETVWVEVQNGPGELLFGGAVKPLGKPFAVIPIPLTIFEARKMGFACLAHLQAWDVRKVAGW